MNNKTKLRKVKQALWILNIFSDADDDDDDNDGLLDNEDDDDDGDGIPDDEVMIEMYGESRRMSNNFKLKNLLLFTFMILRFFLQNMSNK